MYTQLHRLQPTFTAKMDVYAYLLYIDSSDTEKLPTLERFEMKTFASFCCCCC